MDEDYKLSNREARNVYLKRASTNKTLQQLKDLIFELRKINNSNLDGYGSLYPSFRDILSTYLKNKKSNFLDLT